MCVAVPQKEAHAMSRVMRANDAAGQLDMDKFDCVSAGDAYRMYKTRALRILAGKVDDSGSSLADHQLGIDMGGAQPGATPLPPPNTRDGQSMRRLRDKRQKLLYEWWTRHLASPTLVDALSTPGGATFQNGLQTVAHLDALFDRPARPSDLRGMRRDF